MTPSLESFCLALQERDIEIVQHLSVNRLPGQRIKTCVLGVLLSDNGKKTEEYMLSWLTKLYNVYSIRQSLPGTLFEYPALKFAQLFSIEHKEPVLYLHTKGAANPSKQQRQIINMWRHEFVDSKAAYEKMLDGNDLLLPYSGPQNITWLNGFIATANAFASISPISVFDNRFFYEILFKGSSLSCYGHRLNNIIRLDTSDTTNLMYRDINRFSSSFSQVSNFVHNQFADICCHRFPFRNSWNKESQ